MGENEFLGAFITALIAVVGLFSLILVPVINNMTKRNQNKIEELERAHRAELQDTQAHARIERDTSDALNHNAEAIALLTKEVSHVLDAFSKMEKNNSDSHKVFRTKLEEHDNRIHETEKIISKYHPDNK